MILAYIDPGSGALIWQVGAAALAGLLFPLVKFRTHLVRRLRSLLGRPPHEPSGDDNSGTGKE